jgi:leucyl-tRNA synthetase
MSKHLGNVVDPDELVERYGADTIRLAVLYAARPQRSLNWDDSAVLRCNRFLNQVWDFTLAKLAAREATATSVEDEPKDTSEHLRLRLAKWTETGVEKITEDMESLELHTAVRNVMRLFDRIKDFEKRASARAEGLSALNLDSILDALSTLVQLLGPFVPHVAEELWIELGKTESPVQTPWPVVSFQVAA